MGRSGCEQLRHTNVVFVSTEVDKVAQPAGLSSIRRNNLSPKLRCVRRAHTPARTHARPNSAGRIAVAMFPSERDERWVSPSFQSSQPAQPVAPHALPDRSSQAGVRRLCYVLFQLQKHIVIRRVRGHAPVWADGYRSQCSKTTTPPPRGPYQRIEVDADFADGQRFVEERSMAPSRPTHVLRANHPERQPPAVVRADPWDLVAPGSQGKP
jgi:hypothetical protein